MPLINYFPPQKPDSSFRTRSSAVARAASWFLAACGIAGCTAIASPKPQASLVRSIEVEGSPSEVWALIGPFCAIEVWHPAIGKCSEDGKTPTTRTLVTKDGGAIFVELQTARSDAEHRYSYTFTSAPVPVTQYNSTFRVVAKGSGTSIVRWSGAYTPDSGKEEAAAEALGGIYESGLNAIRARLAR